MRRLLQIAGLGLVITLTACEQPAPEAEQAVDAAPAESAQAESAPADTVTSIDADGNIAPFGMASRQPVPVADPEPVATIAESGAVTSDLYNIHCIACHGADAKGVQGLGLNLVDSKLVKGSSEAELTAFLKAGRAADAPDSVTKVPMPGFAWMGDQELSEITAYLKSL